MKIKQIDNLVTTMKLSIINVPDKKIIAMIQPNVLAAVDIVKARLNGQVRKYKDDKVKLTLVEVAEFLHENKLQENNW